MSWRSCNLNKNCILRGANCAWSNYSYEKLAVILFPQKQQLSLNDFLWSIHRRSLAFIKIAQRDTPLISPTTPLLQDCCHFSSHSFHGLEKFLPSEILAESPSAIQSVLFPMGHIAVGNFLQFLHDGHGAEHRDLCHGHILTQPPPARA